jgi:CheY-like chemotaxis protein
MTRNTILYVEDNPSNTMLMEQIVKRISDCQLITACTAEDGMALARSELPDLVLMDINLHGMGGAEALRNLRGFEETSAIPVIAVSAAAMDADIKRAEEAGFDQYITKPLDVLDTLATLKAALLDTKAEVTA